MYDEIEPAAATERTTFRQDEKKYKLYKAPNTKGRGNMKKSIGGKGGGGDLSAVVNFRWDRPVVAPFYEEVNVLELEPKILPDITDDLAKLAEDSFGEAEHGNYPFLERSKPVEFQLRDETSSNKLSE